MQNTMRLTVTYTNTVACDCETGQLGKRSIATHTHTTNSYNNTGADPGWGNLGKCLTLLLKLDRSSRVAS